MVGHDARRSLLFELDTSIKKLRLRTGDCGEVLALTARYHNLLRMWTEV